MARAKNTKRSDGRLQSKVYLGDGKYKYVYANTQRELDRKVQEVKLKIGKGVDVSAERDTFGEWAELWLSSKQPEISVKRYAAYAGNLNRLEALMPMQISKIRAIDIQQIITRRYNDGYAYQTLQSYRSICKQIFDLAIANRVCDFNPANAVKIPKNAEKTTKRALTDEEQQWICAPTEHRCHIAAMIMMYAGLRRGELIPLTWSDIDLEGRIIRINKSVEMVNSRPVVKPCGKTDAAMRNIRIPKYLCDYLRDYPHKSVLVCPSASGEMLTESGWKRMWSSYMTELNLKFGDFTKLLDFQKPTSKFAPKKAPMVIPPITAHWLRHTYITMLYLAGVDVLTAKEQAGHADIKTTMQIYTHLDAQYKNNQIDKLDEYLDKKSNGCQMGVKTG